ncbi:hypothetical protein [Chryseobacterium sp. CT-SW4]|uniref:hypothetical protein n=1 Tax=Chryseobacterium sp. SW-1 TaxID=3157343 RepID=UPI003B02E028
MKKILFIGLFGFISFHTYAQESSDTYNGQKYGYIIDKSGKKIEGIVQLNGSSMSPWQNQSKVKFAAKDDIDKSKSKIKYKSYSAGDIKEYMIYENETPRVFQSVKYTNTREAMNNPENTLGLNAGFKALTNLTKNSQFAELVTDGKIKVYKLYGYPTAASIGVSEATTQSEARRIRENPNYIYSKKGGKIEELSAAKVKTITADCPVVKEKITKGEYGSIKNDTKKRSGVGKLIREEVDNALTDKQSMIKEVINDYNENCR